MLSGRGGPYNGSSLPREGARHEQTRLALRGTEAARGLLRGNRADDADRGRCSPAARAVAGEGNRSRQGGFINWCAFVLLTVPQPLAYLACGFVLLRRTEWCLRRLVKEDGS